MRDYEKNTNNSYQFSVNMLNVHFVTFRIDLVTLSLSILFNIGNWRSMKLTQIVKIRVNLSRVHFVER